MIYHKLGKYPHKRHVQFRKEDGGLFQEELFGKEGFSGHASLLYHIHPPTVIEALGDPEIVAPQIAREHNMEPLNLKGFDIRPESDYIKSHKALFVNNDLEIGLMAPRQSMSDYFYKNSDGDELLFIHKGKGKFKSPFGLISFGYGDYLIIPKGTVYTLEFEGEDNMILYIESKSSIHFPKRYHNGYGQFLEHSPFCERDIRLPEELETHDESGQFLIKIKKHGMIYPYTYKYHPYDLIGWDGYNYPYAFSIFDFEPITGRIHLPPPIHQTFEGRNFVVCSFVPRLYDYHPESIPAPYHHSNIDSDEILYYVDGDFMSRNNIAPGQFTLHPGGIPHGPHPGAIERSIGKKQTEELAVMIDPFNPVSITKEAMNIAIDDYYKAWQS